LLEIARENLTEVLKRFIKPTLTILVAAALLGGGYIAFDRWQDDKARQAAEKRELDEMRKKAYRLLDDYNNCNDKLKADYPNGREMGKEPAYDKANQRCADIKKEQNATASEHNQRAGL
jgi:hypothetical protein